MEINMMQGFIDLDGVPLVDQGKQITLQDMLTKALVAVFKDEEQLSGEEKFERWELALKIKGTEKADLKSEEVVLLKKLVAKAFGTLLCGQIWKILN